MADRKSLSEVQLFESKNGWFDAHTSTDEQPSASTLTELKRCQDAIGTGYLSAYGIDQIERLEKMEAPVWAPYYTIHKIMAGLSSFSKPLLDAYSQSFAARGLPRAKCVFPLSFLVTRKMQACWTLLSTSVRRPPST